MPAGGPGVGGGGGLRQLQEGGAAPSPPHHTLGTCCPWRGSHTCFAQCSCPLRYEVADRPLTMLLRPVGLLRGSGLRLRRAPPPSHHPGLREGEQT